MADTKISALAAGTPAQATDVVPIARAGLNKSLTVADILAGISNFPGVSPAALTDLLAAIRGGVGKTLTVSDLLAAISLLAASAPAQPGDIILANRAGAAVRLLVDDVLSLAPKRNFLDNGSFDVNQRGVVTYNLTNALAYGSVDRWAAKMAGTAQGVLVWQQPSSFTGVPNRVRLARNAASAQLGALSFTEVIETIDATKLAGKTVTLFWRAIAGANLSSAGSLMNVAVAYGTGADQGLASFDAGTWTGQANALNTTQAIAPGGGAFSKTFAMPATATEIAVTFGFTPTGAAGADDSIYVADAWLVEGSNPPNNFAPDPYALQLMRCQRFLPVWSAALGTGDRVDGYATSTTSSFPRFDFKVQPRKAPTGIQVSAFGDFTVFAWKNSGNFAPTNLIFSTAGVNHSQLTATTTAGSPTLAAGDPTSLLMANANAKIIWTGAEL
jgi:hypothetical protein